MSSNILNPFYCCLLLVGLFCSCSISLYGQSIVTDRPDQTESSSTVPKGSFQIESGIHITINEQSSLAERQILLPTNLFRIGISNSVELRVVNQLEIYQSHFSERNIVGMSDLQLGAKFFLLENEQKATQIAFLAHIVIPSGTSHFKGDNFRSINKLAVSHQVNDNFGIAYNLGYNFIEKEKGDFTYTLAFGFGLTDRVSVYIEPYGEFVNLDEHISSFDTGFTYLLKDNVQLDFSFGMGLNHDMNYMAIGSSWNFNKK